MTKDRAIDMIRNLRAISADPGATPSEAETARLQADRLQAKFKVMETDLVAEVKSETRESFIADESTEFLRDFERKLHVEILVAGRKKGRFADHPHVDKILAARQRKAAQS